MCHSISDGSSEGLRTIGGQLAEPNATTPTSEPAKNLDQKSHNSDEQSYESDDGLTGECHPKLIDHCRSTRLWKRWFFLSMHNIRARYPSKLFVGSVCHELRE